jgi:hypothetical protein
MEKVLELKQYKLPKITINNDIDDSKVMFPEKLKAAMSYLKSILYQRIYRCILKTGAGTGLFNKWYVKTCGW